ncbi:segregation/condensation protein A [Streptomyces sp. MB09-01]|nr:segregation/condensation protein A [Streptomyces sp. MB09-01]MDX3536617.1 segregation/condensation protein A [Streptomyces sp. MB09-01]
MEGPAEPQREQPGPGEAEADASADGAPAGRPAGALPAAGPAGAGDTPTSAEGASGEGPAAPGSPAVDADAAGPPSGGPAEVAAASAAGGPVDAGDAAGERAAAAGGPAGGRGTPTFAGGDSGEAPAVPASPAVDADAAGLASGGPAEGSATPAAAGPAGVETSATPAAGGPAGTPTSAGGDSGEEPAAPACPAVDAAGGGPAEADAAPAGGGPVGARGGAGPAGVPAGPAGGDGRFTLRLDNFEGPFDLLLQLISRHKLDVTEVALSKVTDEFMAHIRAMGPDWDLDQTTEFLVVAATLLDLKAARLLPAAEVEDEGDLALLEARDLLFARLLQYRAYKQIAEIFEGRAEAEGRRYPRTVGLEPHHADLLPEVVISIGAEGFARLAIKAMQPKARPQVYVDHIHAPLVSVREQAGLVVRMLKARGEATFQELTEDADDTLTVVARFLALLELYREKAVVLDQEEALQTLTVRWSGGDGDGMPTVTDEFDQIVEAKD